MSSAAEVKREVLKLLEPDFGPGYLDDWSFVGNDDPHARTLAEISWNLTCTEMRATTPTGEVKTYKWGE